jgi:hypothetical protein
VTLLVLLGVSIFKPSVWNLTHTAAAKSFETSDKSAEIFSEKGSTLSGDLFREHSFAAAVSCPAPTIEENGICVLKPPSTNPQQTIFPITSTLELTSDMTLDCKNFTLAPDDTKPNKGVGTGIDPWPGVRSSPEVAVFIKKGVQHVTIQNCNIQNFDFGILAMASKGVSITDVPNVQIIHNVIGARFVGISLYSVDSSLIEDNAVTFKTLGGRGIVVQRDSDLNKIQRNTITADFAGIGAVRSPGPTGSSNKSVSSGAGIVVGQIDGTGGSTLLNVIINSTLYQLVTANANTPTSITKFSAFTEGNSIMKNWITIPSCCSFPDATDGISLPVALGTQISDNTIFGATYSVRIGIQADPQVPKQFPGKCSLRTDNGQTRLCFVDSDCFIAGFDTQNNGETCTNIPTPLPLSWLSGQNTVENNRIQGPFVSGVTLAGKNTVVRGNSITGPQRPVPPPPPPPGTALPGAIFLVGPHALGTAVVTQNTISNVHIALSLQSAFQNLSLPSCTITACPQSCIGAKISANDFTDYDIAVQTDDGYSLLLSALSVNDMGNFWGPACFDPTRVQKRNGDVTNAAKDCFPFSKPVAKAAQNALPAPCPTGG